MKIRPCIFLLALAVVAFLAPTSALAKDKEPKAGTEEKEGKKNLTTLVLNAKPEAIHAAALQALAGIGCEIKKDSPEAIEAKRPNKMGLAVGSGGEKLFVAIKVIGENQTELKVTTKKTLMGIAGQKLWNEEIAAQIRDAVK